MTDLTASSARMGLGLAALGRPGYINLGHGIDFAGDRNSVDAMRERCFEMLDAAYRSGLRDFDAARSYGRAEEFLGQWLDTRRPTDVTISSKWGYTYTAGWRLEAEHHEVKEHSLEKLDAQWRESRALLGERIDYYQIHSAVLETGVLENAAVIGRLGELKAGGTRIGLSLSGPAQTKILEKAREVDVDGRPLFDAVQATFNLFEQSAGPALAAAGTAGMHVIVKEGAANGRLTDRNTLTEDAAQFAAVRAAAARFDAGPDTIALAFVLSRPFVNVTLSGASTIEQLASNLKARDLLQTPGFRAAIDEVAESTRQDAERYWKIRSGLAWN